MQEINQLIVELIKACGVFIISTDDKGRFVYDLDTGMKSYCYATHISKNILKLEMRYNVVKKVNTSKITAKEFCQLIYDECMHGRTYLKSHWIDLFKYYGIELNFNF